MSQFHETTHDVYFDDLDAYRILHNARYILLFERTIGSFWRKLGMNEALDLESHPDQSHLVRQNHIDYLKPVIGTGRVRVRIWIEKLGRTSLIFGFTMMPVDSDDVYATGTRVLVRIDPVTKQPVSWTDKLRDMVSPFIQPRT